MTKKIKVSLPICLGATLLMSSMQAELAIAQSAIMPMGDSITQGTRGQCGYRRILTQNMLNDPSCNVSFVGPRDNPDGTTDAAICAATNTDHAGFSGRNAGEFTDARIANWANLYSPDYYLVHIGSNDIFEGQTIAEIMANIELVVFRVRTRSPNAVMLLANVIPWDTVSSSPIFGPFDNPDVDELVMTAALSSAIESYVASLNDPAVRLVDVRSGFNNSTMTVDGVHPNDLGEALIASRFQQALQDVGVCDVVVPPTKTLARNQWYQLSLPANPNGLNRVRDIFDNLTPGQYGSTWQVFSWNPNQSDTPRQYTDVGIDGVMSQGMGYWVLQTERESLTIDMPVGSTLTPLSSLSQCTSEAGCFRVPLTAQTTSQIDGTKGAFEWELAGYPHFQASQFSSTRVTTSAEGSCGNATGCSPAQADTSQVMNDTLFRWNGQINAYDRISGDDELLPWDGVWVPVLGQGANGNTRWITAPE
ncbi:MAG: GDSL-type esterase/lipase family protein [Granulosicoccus sp.]